MNSKIIYLLTIIVLLVGCTQRQPTQENVDTDVILVIDRTSLPSLYPDVETIWSALRLKEQPWQGIRLTITSVGHTNINPDTTLVLPGTSRTTSSKRTRKEQLVAFYVALERTLEQYRSDTVGMDKSIIFRNLIQHLNTLSQSDADQKALWVYSDLLENSSVSFYSAKTLSLLSSHPEKIIAQLENGTPLENCTGCHVSFMYAPVDYTDNSRYMTIVEFYTQYFSSHGITVHAGLQPGLQ